MTGETIKSFLVGLGFGVDEASLAKFNKSIVSATLRVTALAAAVESSAGGIAYGIAQVSKGFEDLGYELKILAPAINKTLTLRSEMYRAYSATGVNLVKVVQSAAKLNLSLEKTKIVIQAIYRSTASRFFELLTKQSDLFRQKIYANLPRIQALLERSVKFIFKMLEAVTDLGIRLWSILTRVYDMFVLLDNATNGWSTAILAAVAAWKVLNLGFLATPLGALIAGFTALLVLWDDFKTFIEGGETLIDWGSKTTQMIVGLTAVILPLATAVWAIIAGYRAWTSVTKAQTLAQAALNIVASLNPFGIILVAVTALVAGLTALDAKWNIFHGHISGFFQGVGGKLMNFASGGNFNPGIPSASPVGSGAQNSNTNQNVNMQTNVHIQSAADAPSIGRHVGNEVSKQNLIGTRMLKSATAPAGEN